MRVHQGRREIVAKRAERRLTCSNVASERLQAQFDRAAKQELNSEGIVGCRACDIGVSSRRDTYRVVNENEVTEVGLSGVGSETCLGCDQRSIGEGDPLLDLMFV
jgi:hypothetical protein